MNAVTVNAVTVVERAVTALGYREREQELATLAGGSKTIVAITNQDGYEQCHSARMVLKNLRVEIEKGGKAARDEATAFNKAVLVEERRLIGLIQPEEDRLEKLQKEWDDRKEAERQARVQAELNRVNAIKVRVGELRGCVGLIQRSPRMPSATIAQHIADLEAVPVDDSFAEFRQQAEETKAESVAALREAHRAALEREAEAERLRLEREELDRQRAAQEAERARLAEEQRAARAERERQQATEQEQLRQQREQLERDQRALDDRLRAEKETQERVRAEQERREQQEAQQRRDEEQARLRQQEAAKRSASPPSLDEMIEVLAIHYKTDARTVNRWLASYDWAVA